MRRIRQFVSCKQEKLVRFTAMGLTVLLAMAFLSQAAFAQNTYVITDGDQVVVHTTHATDPAHVLDEAGLSLGTEDSYTTQESNGVSEITIQRKQTVTIEDDGQTIQVDSYGETVQELLSRMNVELSAGATVSAELGQQTYDGMILTIDRTVEALETYSKALPFETTYVDDDTLPQGQEKVVTQGQDGELRCISKVLYKEGREISRTVLEEQIVTEPVEQVIARGTAQEASPAPAGSNTLTLPSGETLHYTRKLQVTATAYTCGSESGITATGTTARYGAIAVDPSVIPYGTRMYIVSDDGAYVYGFATAEDTGGAIVGNRVDLYYNTESECFAFGRRGCQVYILG